MDPCQFVRIVIGNLGIRFPGNSSSDGCYCKIRFSDFPAQSSAVPVIPQEANNPDGSVQTVSACFNLTKSDVDRLVKLNRRPVLKIDVYSSTGGAKGCGFGFGSGKLVGRVAVPVELSQQEGNKVRVMQNGWVLVGERKKKGLNPQLYLSVKAQPDPRFVFEFDGEPECSPQVFQVQGNIRQPVFTCKFSFRHSGDRNLGSCSTMSETSTSRSWLSWRSDKKAGHDPPAKERKGWSITIHDLSGSPVAAASMVTPFVPSQGSDRVSRSNPGAWLILRPGDATWKPWGRLEAWREPTNPSDGVGFKFELLPDASCLMSPAGITLAQCSVPTGGKFAIDITGGASPAGSPNGSFDFASWTGSGSGSSTASSGSELGPGQGWWPGLMYKGFVMSSTVGGDVAVEVGAQHVTCTEDAAAFVALAAAVDLSMDACRPFSQKLRKELRQNSGEFVV